MKLQLFLGGLFIGTAIGLMLGGYMVEIPEDVTGKRQYPQGIAHVGIDWRGSYWKFASC